MTNQKLTLKIIGIDCAGCAKNFEKKLLALNGMLDARVNIIFKRLYLEFDPGKLEFTKIEDFVKKSGYSVYEEIEDESTGKISDRKHKQSILRLLTKKKSFYTTIVAGLLLLIGGLLEFVIPLNLPERTKNIPARVILIIATLIGGIFIFRKAFYSIRNLNIDINILMSVAAIAAIIIGEDIEAASIVFLFSIAEIAEEISIESARNSIERLIDYAPSTSTILTSDGEQIVQADEVEPRTKIIVKSGDRIPLDGIVVSGKSYVNQAPITGESWPALKTKDSTVYAGTLCEDGTLTIETTKRYEDIFLKKIVELVENSDQRAPIDRYIDTFAKYYTPIMFLIASLTLLIPPLVIPEAIFLDWVKISLVILVISCPCAVVLSTPIAIVTAISKSARNGVLIKGGSYLEILSKTDVYAFDKTGTLTIGHPEVVDIITNESVKRDELLKICGSLEMNSKHPIAKAIREKMLEENIKPYDVSNFKTIAGMGIKGDINGQTWLAGNYRLIQENELKVNSELAAEIAIKQQERKSIVIISNSKEVFGIISVWDQLKPHAKGLVVELRELGIKKSIMLTGDNSKTAAEIARELTIDDYYAELLPDQKMDLIDNLYADYGHIAMIGDGINDAPALAHANVGIAMGASGSDIALESADIALMTDSFESLHYLITISRKVMRIIKENITIAIIIKLILFVLSYLGLIDLWMAVLIGDMGVSLFVIFNSILRVKGKKMTHTYCDDAVCDTMNGTT